MNNQKIQSKHKSVFSLLVIFSFFSTQILSVSARVSFEIMAASDAVNTTGGGHLMRYEETPLRLLLDSLYPYSTAAFVTLSFLFLLFVINFVVLKKQYDETKIRSAMLVSNILAAVVIFFFLGVVVASYSMPNSIMVT